MNHPRNDWQRHFLRIWDEAILPGSLIVIVLLFAVMVIWLLVPHDGHHDRVHQPQQYSGTVGAVNVVVPNPVPVLPKEGA